MRVPKRFADVEPRKVILASLKTRDVSKAEARCLEFERQLIAMWEARIAGEAPEYEKIVHYCQTMGFAYKQTGSLTDSDLIARILTASEKNQTESQALLGTVKAPKLKMSKLPAIYE